MTEVARVRRTTGRLLPVLVVLLSMFALPAARSQATAPPPPHAVRALFFGDSLMNGTGARPTRPVMARVAAKALGWDVTVDAWGGTGFTTGGRRGKTYLARLAAPGVLSTPYDVVLHEGGTNDREADAATMHARTTETVHYVRSRLPNARVVLMGAFDPRSRRSDSRRIGIDRVIRQVAQEQGLPFFSPIFGDWARGQGTRFLSADGLHPSTYGYGVMGTKLVAALRAALKPVTRTPTQALYGTRPRRP